MRFIDLGTYLTKMFQVIIMDPDPTGSAMNWPLGFVFRIMGPRIRIRKKYCGDIFLRSVRYLTTLSLESPRTGIDRKDRERE
jgi:hypothetical protein